MPITVRIRRTHLRNRPQVRRVRLPGRRRRQLARRARVRVRRVRQPGRAALASSASPVLHRALAPFAVGHISGHGLEAGLYFCWPLIAALLVLAHATGCSWYGCSGPLRGPDFGWLRRRIVSTLNQSECNCKVL